VQPGPAQPGPVGGPTQISYPQAGQPTPPQAPPGYPQQQPWAPYAGGPPGKPPRRVNPAWLFGIGGGLLVVIVAAIVIVLVTRDDSSSSAKDPLTPTANATTAAPTESPTPTNPFSESPTDPFSDEPSTSPTATSTAWPSQLPTDKPKRYPDRSEAVKAPKNAPVQKFCDAYHLITDLPDGDVNAYYAWFWYRISIGTPSDMTANQREGWVEEVAPQKLDKKKFDAYLDYQSDKCY